MFSWLAKIFDNVRIALEYPRFETDCRQRWLSYAEQKYSTAHIEQLIKDKMAAPIDHASLSFDEPIGELVCRSQNIRREIDDAADKLPKFVRDYKSELDAANEERNRAYDELAKCNESLSDAYADISSSKSSLDAWYNKAEGHIFGNAGRKLPKRTFFGQDLSDRDSYKTSRDSAACDIDWYKFERTEIQNRIGEIKETIHQIKTDRQIFDLQQAGFDKRPLLENIDRGNRDLHSIWSEIVQIKKRRNEYIHQAQLSLGVYDLEKEIDRLRSEKDRQLRSFDAKLVRAERKVRHRAEWLAAHGR